MTLTKLKLFEFYAQQWIPVFLAPPSPRFNEVHLFDFFCGPGKDQRGEYGSPLRILDQLRRYERQQLAGWKAVKIVAHLHDAKKDKVENLKRELEIGKWNISGVEIDARPMTFSDALQEHRAILQNAQNAKLLFIDQTGVNAVSDEIFRQLVGYPTTDFMFFLSSAILHRFRTHAAIKPKIGFPKEFSDVHRKAFEHFKELLPPGVEYYLAPFSLKKGSNIYGLIFGSRHPLGMHKFLQVAWKNDDIAGEANFDINHENRHPGDLVLGFPEMQTSKVSVFEKDLEAALRLGRISDEAALVRFCIDREMTCQHSAEVLKKLKSAKVIDLAFRVPQIERLRDPRPVRLVVE